MDVNADLQTLAETTHRSGRRIAGDVEARSLPLLSSAVPSAYGAIAHWSCIVSKGSLAGLTMA